jgi:hypothetical protein
MRGGGHGGASSTGARGLRGIGRRVEQPLAKLRLVHASSPSPERGVVIPRDTNDLIGGLRFHELRGLALGGTSK